MKTVTLCLLIFTIVILEGCCLGSKNDVYFDFSNDDLSWQIYNSTDTLVFENQIGNQQKYLVTSIEKDTLQEYNKFGGGCDINHRTEIRISFSNISKYPSNPIPTEEIILEKSSSGLYIQMNWEDVYGYSLQDNIKDTITVDGIKYGDIHIAKIDTTQYNLEIWRWYYSKSKGIVRFDGRNCDVWIRKN